MADEQSRAPFNKPSPVPKNVNWQSLLRLDGDELETHYRHVLESLGREKRISPNPSLAKDLNLAARINWNFVFLREIKLMSNLPNLRVEQFNEIAAYLGWEAIKERTGFSIETAWVLTERRKR
jgi:hypothetical protein